MADEEFEVGDAGASQVEKVESQRLKNGSLVMIKDFPCKVTEVSTAKPGKHGSAKVILKGKDILTAKVYDCTYHSGDMVDAPIVKRDEYQLLEITQEDTLELLQKDGEVKSDVNVPTEEHLKEQVAKMKEMYDAGKVVLVTVLSTLGKEMMVEAREGQE